MSIARLTENLNIIQMLSDRPIQNATDLKSEFDEAAGIIKTYLNDVVAPGIDNVESIANSKLGTTEFEKLKGELNGKIEEKIQKLDEILLKIQNTATSYEDFVVETKTIPYSVTQSETKNLSGTYDKTGYKPLGIVGHYYSNLYGGTANGAYVSDLTNTQITVKGTVARGNTGGTTAGNLFVNILWMKIKEKTTEETE